MQNSTNGLINISNKSGLITQSNIAVDADSSGQSADWKTGTKAKVTFTVPSTAEGPSSLKKYEARWATAAQAKSLGAVPINFSTLETNFPNQLNTQTDICNTTGALSTFVNLSGLTNSTINADGSADNDTRVGVFVRAYTQDDDGNFVAGADGATDVSASAWLSSGTTALTATNGTTNVSLGFFVSGVPDAPTPVSVRTGSDTVIFPSTNTDMHKDASMNKNLILAFNDYNVNQRGSNYDQIRYAIVRASDAQYGDELADTSFSTGTGAWNGNDSAAESLVISGVGAVLNEYDTVNSVWKARAVGLKDASNGEAFSIAYAFDNSNGMGFRAPWVNFVPSQQPNAKLSLYGLDASTNALTGAAGAGWGYGLDGTASCQL